MSKKKIYALGFFDGVHLGHQALLRECLRLSREMGATPAAITFDRHPQALFSPEPPKLLTDTADRQRLLGQYGVAHILVFPVNMDVMSTDWQDFLQILVDDDAAGFVCGADFRFGHRGAGNAEKLAAFCKARNLPCIIVPDQMLEGIRISSTHIRRLLEAGDVETAARFLGHPHILSGTVVTGRQVGRTIGVPTANILIDEGLVVPKLGVYACKIHTPAGIFNAVTNIGSRPTVGGHQVRAESWILDFDGDLYGKALTLELHKFLRPEQKFDSLDALKAQIRLDAHRVRQLMSPQ